MPDAGRPAVRVVEASFTTTSRAPPAVKLTRWLWLIWPVPIRVGLGDPQLGPAERPRRATRR